MNSSTPSDFSHCYAIAIEHTMARVFGCSHTGENDLLEHIGGLVDASTVSASPYYAMVATLMYLYATASPAKREAICKFINTYSYLEGQSLEDILHAPKGEKTYEKLESAFNALCGSSEV